mmetsp:Transcript_4464/g.10513  ORF Transcript_4464/g.10513 Transcript_4464/m.10513 type:complete len:374 (-) Transcript_4464:174-1295(-)
MSHRKYERPRHGSLGYLPRKRSKSFRNYKTSQNYESDNTFPYINIFIGHKIGMTHILRNSKNSSSRLFNKEVCDAVTIISTPSISIIGISGYILSNNSFRKLKSMNILNDQTYRNSINTNKNKNYLKDCLNTYTSIHSSFFKLIISYCSVIRLECITNSTFRMSKKHKNIVEIQILGGTISSKVEYGVKLLGRKLHIDSVFKNEDIIDIVSVTKGHGKQGVISRWGITRLPRKTHRGLRKVACIGPWSPSRVSWTIARSGQMGFHKRTETNKKLYKIGTVNDYSYRATTSIDVTNKTINVMGGFLKYGLVKSDYIMVKGSISGTIKRPVLLKKSFYENSKKNFLEKIELQFIDTSSNLGHGRYQTSSDKLLHI